MTPADEALVPELKRSCYCDNYKQVSPPQTCAPCKAASAISRLDLARMQAEYKRDVLIEEVVRLSAELAEARKDAARYETALRAIEAEGWKNAADENPILDPANATLMWELASNALENDDEDAAIGEKEQGK